MMLAGARGNRRDGGMAHGAAQAMQKRSPHAHMQRPRGGRRLAGAPAAWNPGHLSCAACCTWRACSSERRARRAAVTPAAAGRCAATGPLLFRVRSRLLRPVAGTRGSWEGAWAGVAAAGSAWGSLLRVDKRRRRRRGGSLRPAGRQVDTGTCTRTAPAPHKRPATAPARCRRTHRNWAKGWRHREARPPLCASANSCRRHPGPAVPPARAPERPAPSPRSACGGWARLH